MSLRISLALPFLFLLGCAEQSPSPQVWLQWCSTELKADQAQKPTDLPSLRESFVAACNQSLAEQMNMTQEEFADEIFGSGFRCSGDTLVWSGFFSDSALNLVLAPSFELFGADTALTISNYESCFYRTLDMCFGALVMERKSDTAIIDLPFLLRPEGT
jgi:hypothetical protein